MVRTRRTSSRGHFPSGFRRIGWLGAAVLLAACSAPRASAADLEDTVRALAKRLKIGSTDYGVALWLSGPKPAALVNADRPLKPASTLKLLVTAAAIQTLGIDHRWETTVVATAPIVEGTIAGDLIVRGAGDPNISGRFHGGDPTALFRTWARKLRENGLRRVTGRVLADENLFDDVRYPPSWDPDQYGSWYSAEVSALSLNDNCLDVTVLPGPAPGGPATVRWVPRCDLVEVRSTVTTAGSGSPVVGLYRSRNSNSVRAAGKIPAKSRGWSGNVTIRDPASFFVSVLARTFEEEGIPIGGSIGKVPRTGPGSDPSAPHLLVRHTSTLARDLPVIHKNSQNLHAELLLRLLGTRASRPGSVAGGERMVKGFLAREGISADGAVLRDGSGLSHANRLTARQLGAVLGAVRGKPWFATYRDSLAVGGIDGTLKSRFRGLPHLRGNVHAKTGTISGVSCLAGYVRRGDRSGCFAILVNGQPGAGAAREFQERVVDAVYQGLR